MNDRFIYNVKGVFICLVAYLQWPSTRKADNTAKQDGDGFQFEYKEFYRYLFLHTVKPARFKRNTNY